MHKLYYSLDTPRTARLAVDALKRLGIADKHIALAARPDIELERLPDTWSGDVTDFEPGMKRGLVLGGTTGMLAGLIAAAIPPLGITLAGGALIGVVGTAVGAWASALAGSAIPNDLRRLFDQEIARGRVLLSTEVPHEAVGEVRDAMAALGPSATPIATAPAALAS